MQGWWFPLCPPSTPLFGLCRRQMILGEWQWIIISLTKGWLQLQLLYQMWFHSLSKLTYPLVPGMQLLVLQRPFYLYIPKSVPRRVCFQLARLAIHLYCPNSGVYYLSSPVHSLDCRDLDCPSPPQGITLVHYIDHIVLIGSSEEEVATTLDLLGRHLCIRGWKVTLTKI